MWSLYYNLPCSILDEGGIRRRINLSSSQRELSATPLNARVPLGDLVTGQVWTDGRTVSPCVVSHVYLCVDMTSLVESTAVSPLLCCIPMCAYVVGEPVCGYGIAGGVTLQRITVQKFRGDFPWRILPASTHFHTAVYTNQCRRGMGSSAQSISHHLCPHQNTGVLVDR